MEIEKYLREFPADQDQISRDELRIILTEFSRILDEKVDGEVVEFGCYKGETSEFFAKILRDKKSAKTLWLYDSFEGLPAKSRADFSVAGADFKKGELFAKKRKVEEKFAKMGVENVRIVKGFFAEIADRKVPNEICFAFFDGDFYESIRDSFRKCEQKFAGNATIIIDDYSNEKLPGARKAVDEFREKYSEKIANFREEKSLAIIKLK
jgi:O-methyltransferase